MKSFEQQYYKRNLIYENDCSHVYKAINSITQDKVILKVLVKQSDNKEYIDKLIEEINILRNMENTNLIAVNRVGTYKEYEKTYYYIESEYFEGETLENMISSKRFDYNQGLKIIKQVIDGLKEFHFKNRNYKNLSANNILINSKDLVKIDTLAYLEEKDFDLLEENEAWGDFDDSEDIYSLGVILCQIILGKLDSNILKYKKQIDDKYLYHMIEKATSRKFINQYSDLNDFLTDINSYLEFGGVSSENQSEPEEILFDKELLEDDSEWDEEDEEYEEYDEYDRHSRGILAKVLILCLFVFVSLGITVKGMKLFNKNDNSDKVNITSPVEELSSDDEDEDKSDEDDKEVDDDTISEKNNDEPTTNLDDSNNTTDNNSSTNNGNNTTNNSTGSNSNTGSNNNHGSNSNTGSNNNHGSSNNTGGNSNTGNNQGSNSDTGSNNTGGNSNTGGSGGSNQNPETPSPETPSDEDNGGTDSGNNGETEAPEAGVEAE